MRNVIRTAYNTSGAAVTVDFEGRQIHSGDWGPVDTTSDEASPLIAAGSLVLTPDISEDAPQAARNAAALTESVAVRVASAVALDKADLAGLVKGLVPDDATKTQLEWAIALRQDIVIPAAPEPPVADPPSPEPDTGPAAATDAAPETDTKSKRRNSHPHTPEGA